MAMLKFGNAAVVTPRVCPGKWEDNRIASAGGRVVTASRDVVATYDPSKWLLSHVSIMASVDVDLAKPGDPKSNYLIKPEYSIFVNNNGDSWERALLAAASKTFLGADNFIEHVQIPSLSKGKVIDVALREVPFTKDAEGNDLTTIYVDILIATNRKHADIIQKIETNEYSAVSMGCGLAGTPIVLPDGSLRKIEDIEEGDLVLTHTGREKRVTKLFSKSVGDIPLFSVDYVGANEPLRLTGEHPILIAPRSSVRCTKSRQICHVDKEQNSCFWQSKVRGKVKFKCGRDKQSYKYDYKFVPISEVKKGDYVVRVFPTEVRENDLFTDDICRLLGIYAGDGYTGWQWRENPEGKGKNIKDYPAYTGFCLGLQEKRLIKEVKEILSRVVAPGTTVTDKPVPERNGFYINVYDKKLASFLYENCGEGAYTKKFSKEVMYLPPEKQLVIVSGMIDTDGGYYGKNSFIYYSSSSSDLINQTHLMLLRNKIGNAREKVFRKGTGKKAGIGRYFQETVTVHKSFSYLIPSRKNRSYGLKPKVKQENCFFHENYYLSEITSVSSLRFSGVVYNFSVEEDESYSVNNAAVHNCLIAYSQCSQCGRIAEDESQACNHIRFYKKNYFYDHNGIKRIVAELCGRAEDPDSCKFIDASWVRKPAFEGAVLRNIVNLAPDLSDKIQKAVSVPSFKYEPGMNLRAASQSASSVVSDLLGGGTEKRAADDVNFPEAPADTEKDLKVDEPPKEEAPADDSRFESESGGGESGGGEETPSDEATLGDSLGDSEGAGGGEAPAGGGGQTGEGAPEPQINEPKTDATIDEVKDMVKNQLLNKMRRDLLKELAETEENDRPVRNENSLMNDNLVKNAGLKSVLASARETGNDRLYNGILILSNLNSPERFSKYGYRRDDMLAILHFVDREISSEPVGADAVKALSRVKLGSEGLVPFFTEMIVETGRKPGRSEASRLATWAELLSCFE